MSKTNSQKTVGLMLLSILFGGIAVFIFDRTALGLPEPTTSSQSAIIQASSDGNSQLPVGHPTKSSMLDQTAEPKPINIGSIDDLVIGLRNRLETNPNDPKGWALLAKSYQHLGHKEAAFAAADTAKQLGYEGPILAPSTGNTQNPHTLIHQESPMYDDDFFKSTKESPASTK